MPTGRKRKLEKHGLDSSDIACLLRVVLEARANIPVKEYLKDKVM